MPWASWRRPCSASSRLSEHSQRTCSGEHAAPAATQAARPGGNAGQRGLGAIRASANSTKQPLPDPVRRGRDRCCAKRCERGLDGRFAARAAPARTHCRATVPETKSRYCRGRGIPRQIRGLEQGGGGHVHARVDQQVPGRRQLDRRQPLADPFGPGIVAADEDRHVGAQLQAELGQPLDAQIQCPTARPGRPARSPHRTSRRRSRRRPECAFRRRCRHLACI